MPQFVYKSNQLQCQRFHRIRMLPLHPLILLLLLIMAHLNGVQSFHGLLARPNDRCHATTRKNPSSILTTTTPPVLPLFDKDPLSSSESESSFSERNNQDDDNEPPLFESLASRWNAADPWEIRSDATVVSCHTLARFLAYDMTTPIKPVPGYEVEDVIALLDTFTSCVVLASLWTAAGLVTRLFENSNNGGDEAEWGRLVQTTALAAPPWLLLEYALGWPAFDSNSGAERFILGFLGLLATMSLARLVSSKLLPRL